MRHATAPGPNFGWLAAATVAGQAIGFAVLTLAARRLGPGLLGAYGFALGIVTYIGAVTNVGVNLLGSREVAGQQEDMAATVSEVLLLQAALAALACAIAWLGRDLLTSSRLVASLIAINVLGIAAQALSFGWLLQAVGRPRSLAVAQLAGQIAYGALAFAFLSSGRDGVIEFAWMNACGLAITALLSGAFAWHHGMRIARFDPAALKTRLVASLRVGLGLLVLRLYFAIGPVALGYLASETDVGYFSVAQKIPMALIALATVWVSTWLPHATRMGSTDPAALHASLERIVRLVAIITTFAVVVSGVIGTEAMELLFGERYGAAGAPFAALTAAAGVVGVGSTLAATVIALGGEVGYTRSVAVGGAVAAVATLVLVPRLGALGAAIGLVVAESTIIVLMRRRYESLIGRPLALPLRSAAAVGALTLLPAAALHLAVAAPSVQATLLTCVPAWAALAAALALRYPRTSLGTAN